MQKFAKFPLLRLLIPFILGILVSLHSSAISVFTSLSLIPLLVFVLVVLLIVQVYFNIKFWISVWIDITLFICGYQAVFFHDISHQEIFIKNYICEDEKQYLIVKPIDVIVYKENKNRLFLKSCKILDKKTGKWENVLGNILVYFSKNLNIDSIYHPNKFYLLHTHLQKVLETKNPYTFNYAQYLKNQDIYYTAFVKELSEFKSLSVKENWSLLDIALYTRYKIIEYWKNNKYLDNTEKLIATAFLTGFDDEIDRDIINQFAYSGVLHILSVSGFHAALLFLMIEFIFSLIDKYKRWRWIRMISITSILFFYAFMTGFAPPIIRAAIILSLYVIQQNFYTYRSVHPLNMLSAAAFFILIYNPFSIQDIGFLLSFSATTGLIYFAPKIIFENRILQYTWDIASLSIGAQLATLPVSLYFFHSFSFLFIFANILIIPLSTIIMYMCIIALIPVSYFSIILNYLIKSLLFLNHYFALPYFYYNNIHFTFIDALMLSAILVFSRIIYEQIKEKEIHWIHLVNSTLSLLIIWIILHTSINYSNSHKTKIAFFLDNKKHYYFLQKNNSVLFHSIDSLAFNRWMKNMLLQNCYNNYAEYDFNYVQIKNKKILFCKNLSDTVLIPTIRPKITFMILPLYQQNKINLNHLLIKYPFIETIYTNKSFTADKENKKIISLQKNKMDYVELSF